MSSRSVWAPRPPSSGSVPHAVPPGVPVDITEPGFRVTKPEKKWTSSRTFQIIIAVVLFWRSSSLTQVRSASFCGLPSSSVVTMQGPSGAEVSKFLPGCYSAHRFDADRRANPLRCLDSGGQISAPNNKQLESFDFKAIPSLNKMLVLDLARGDYIDRRENVILLGPSGVGKTHVALALGLAACQKGLGVRFTTASQLVHEMIEARDEKRLLRLQDQLARVSLLIVNELG